MKKKMLLALISIVLVCTVVFFMACDGESDTFDENINLSHDDLGVAPNAEAIKGIDAPDASKLNVTSSELSEDAAVKEAATYLFNLANDNLSKVNYYANYAYGGFHAGTRSANKRRFGYVYGNDGQSRERLQNFYSR